MFLDPMLAKPFSGRFLEGVTYSQRKLDGVRCIANEEGLWTRSGRRITSCKHIEEALSGFFSANPEEVLDGELFHRGLDLSSIISQANRRHASALDSGEAAPSIEFHIFDMASGVAPFAERLRRLNVVVAPWLKDAASLAMVHTDLVYSSRHLDELYLQYLQEGYEGQMIRLNRPYERRRSTSLLKRKPFDEAEFAIQEVDVKSSENGQYVKRVILVSASGRLFGANVAGVRIHEEQLATAQFHSATVRFNGLTSGHLPRCPVAVALHPHAREL